jgi:hypothetical protein
MSSLLSAIRDAVRPGQQPHALDEVEAETGATAPIPAAPLVEANSSGGTMSANQTLAGAAQAATSVITTAAATGANDGFKAAMDRVNGVLSADGIKGDAKRMTAAMDLANASPDMSAEGVVAFVTANVPATTASAPIQPAAPASATQASAYEMQRLAAASLAMPAAGGTQASAGPKISASAIFEMRRNAQKGA